MLGQSHDLVGVFVAAALMGVCALGFAVTRANAVRRTFATSKLLAESDLELLRSVAQIQRARLTWFVAACALASTAGAALPLDSLPRLLILSTAVMLFGIGVFALSRYQLLLGLRAEPGLRVWSHGHFLFAARNGRLVGWATVPLVGVSRIPVAKLRT